MNDQMNVSYIQQQHLQSLRDIDMLKRNIIEWQLKYSSLTDEICKVKQKSDTKIYELQKQLEDEMVMSKEKEAQINTLQKELDQKNNLFNEFKQQYSLLEKKYLKLKKLVKDLQQREQDLLQKDQLFRQTFDEEKQQSTSMIDSLQERITRLEQQIGDKFQSNESKVSDKEVENDENSSNSISISCATDDHPSKTDRSFNEAISQSENISLLDISYSKQKAELVSRGSLANRQPPSSNIIKKNSSLSSLTSNNDVNSESSDNNESTNAQTEFPTTSTPKSSMMEEAVAIVKCSNIISNPSSCSSSPSRSQAKMICQQAAAAILAKNATINVGSRFGVRNSDQITIPQQHQHYIESPLLLHDNLTAELMSSSNVRYMSPATTTTITTASIPSPIRSTVDNLQTSTISSSSGSSLISPNSVSFDNDDLISMATYSGGSGGGNQSVDESFSPNESSNTLATNSLSSCHQQSSLPCVNTFPNSLSVTDWSVLDVVEFLAHIHLGSYGKRFQDENITGVRFIQLDSAQLKV
ncbi:hypothetical protein BLA29_004443 [Euroglyphus maynei]|uniref:SAM domain-containing protein n=1 Tax=Euroglyphus maynei TaxID=6958 RepID=A0A1Y3B9C8_EURMA|nr:hypothetical protein BLA29_004443 [Euroglyphus maynei]